MGASEPSRRSHVVFRPFAPPAGARPGKAAAAGRRGQRWRARHPPSPGVLKLPKTPDSRPGNHGARVQERGAGNTAWPYKGRALALPRPPDPGIAPQPGRAAAGILSQVSLPKMEPRDLRQPRPQVMPLPHRPPYLDGGVSRTRTGRGQVGGCCACAEVGGASVCTFACARAERAPRVVGLILKVALLFGGQRPLGAGYRTYLTD